MFTVPIEERYFEDYVANSVHEFGAITVEEAEIIQFGQRYDPQPFHIDPAAARESMFGGVIASGWHTAGLMMRLIVEYYLSSVASLGSPGIDELRWLKPVRPGDTLSVRATVLETKRSGSKPDRGIVRTRIEVLRNRNLISCAACHSEERINEESPGCCEPYNGAELGDSSLCSE